jgi:hypothetical protein
VRSARERAGCLLIGNATCADACSHPGETPDFRTIHPRAIAFSRDRFRVTPRNPPVIALATEESSGHPGARECLATHLEVLPCAADGCVAPMIRKPTCATLTSDCRTAGPGVANQQPNALSKQLPACLRGERSSDRGGVAGARRARPSGALQGKPSARMHHRRAPGVDRGDELLCPVNRLTDTGWSSATIGFRSSAPRSRLLPQHTRLRRCRRPR